MSDDEQYKQELRERAEDRRRTSPDQVRDPDPTALQLAEMPLHEIGKLIHELRVHQIELELQNDELRKTQFDLEKSRREFADLYDFAPAGHLTLDRDGLILKANLRVTEMLGVERTALVNRRFYEFAGEQERDQLFLFIRQAFQTLERRSCELELIGKERRTFHALLESQAEPDQCRIALIDISDRARARVQHEILEEQLRRSQKMATAGTLAGGIAHDFNNLLGIIMLSADMMSHELPPEGPQAPLLDRITKSCMRGRDLIKQLLVFSRKAPRQTKIIELGTNIRSALHQLRSAIQETVRISAAVPEQYGLIECDPTELHQVIANLCTNAANAMNAAGGVIAIKPERRRYAAEELHGQEGAQPGQFVGFSVRDTGTGIDPETLERIFEPFFTTRAFGDGSGMGLAVVHGIVRECGGIIEVESEIGMGTRVRVLFPLAEGRANEEPPPPAEPVPGSGSILIVDDDESLIDLLKIACESLGYDVRTARDGHAGLEEFKTGQAGFDLVITDQIMPGMTGTELAHEIFSIQPDMPIVLCSAHSNLISPNAARELGFCDFVRKPFTLIEISAAIHRALSHKKSS